MSYSKNRNLRDDRELCIISGEAIKGVRRMPWLQKAMKDVASCDKLGRDAYDL